MRPHTNSPRRGSSEDGAALAAAAVCGLALFLLVFASAVEAIAPFVHPQLTMAALR